ncbi:MAG: hypothetical protein ACHQLQ_04755 [Candidatus Acidiferrales bacterium]
MKQEENQGEAQNREQNPVWGKLLDAAPFRRGTAPTQPLCKMKEDNVEPIRETPPKSGDEEKHTYPHNCDGKTEAKRRVEVQFKRLKRWKLRNFNSKSNDA